jgi:hypothetical protein
LQLLAYVSRHGYTFWYFLEAPDEAVATQLPSARTAKLPDAVIADECAAFFI